MKIFSRSLLTALCIAPIVTFAQEGENLLSPLTTTKFWYPPHASAQPDTSGDQFTIDLAEAAGAPMAVFEVDLPEGMKPGGQYVFRFTASATPTGPIIVVVPEADPSGKAGDDGKPAGKSDWGMHNTGGKERAVEFIYDPEVNPQKIQFFWNGDIVDQQISYSFSHLGLTSVD